jgi:hypothetical protein
MPSTVSCSVVIAAPWPVVVSSTVLTLEAMLAIVSLASLPVPAKSCLRVLRSSSTFLST